MPLFRAVMAAGLAFLGFIAIFMGVVMTIAVLKSGEIQVSWGEEAAQQRRILLDETPGEFWTYFGLFGVLPVVLGAGAIAGGRRLTRS